MYVWCIVAITVDELIKPQPSADYYDPSILAEFLMDNPDALTFGDTFKAPPLDRGPDALPPEPDPPDPTT